MSSALIALGIVLLLVLIAGFWAVGIWYEDFEPVPEAEILELLRQATPATAAAAVMRP